MTKSNSFIVLTDGDEPGLSQTRCLAASNNTSWRLRVLPRGSRCLRILPHGSPADRRSDRKTQADHGLRGWAWRWVFRSWQLLLGCMGLPSESVAESH
eukprot:Skav212236  [mRNA]  locus=scaffold4106:37601:38744:+ [translate_table: standard]